jgi:hypothetical protein
MQCPSQVFCLQDLSDGRAKMPKRETDASPAFASEKSVQLVADLIPSRIPMYQLSSRKKESSCSLPIGKAS